MCVLYSNLYIDRCKLCCSWLTVTIISYQCTTIHWYIFFRQMAAVQLIFWHIVFNSVTSMNRVNNSFQIMLTVLFVYAGMWMMMNVRHLSLKHSHVSQSHLYVHFKIESLLHIAVLNYYYLCAWGIEMSVVMF